MESQKEHTVTSAPDGRSIRSRLRFVASKLPAAAVVAFVIGDLPTLYQLWASETRGISFWEVGESDRQISTWRKNIDCYGHASRIADDHRVSVLVCPSGDVLINFQTSDGPAPYWVVKPRSTRGAAAAAHPPPMKQRIAQGFEIICQRFVSQDRVLRRIKYPNNECVDQIINAYSGLVLQQTRTRCDPSC